MGCLNSKSENVITVQQKNAGQRPQIQGFDSESELSLELDHQTSSHPNRAESLEQPQDESNKGHRAQDKSLSRANEENNSAMH